ncbi:MAG TPA: exo-alpha-sialidase, partial [Chloroflexota bacterium]|nr:exo-alpha-sialidase [Chloroflexota bacterium]
MSETHLLLVGTKKGVFIGRAAAAQRGPGAWRFSGPHCSGTWSFYDVTYDAESETVYGGGQSNWYGAAVWRSRDLGATWDHSSEGLAYPDGPGIEQVWRVRRAGETLYAGVDPAGLFRSEDGGLRWSEVSALRARGASDEWRQTNGGLPLHAILPRPQDGGTKSDAPLVVAISSGGVYRSAPGGRTNGTASTDGGGSEWERSPMAGDACVHALVQTIDGALYQQSHAGVWRSTDGGASWSDVSEGLPSRFGFPLAAHPRAAGTVYAVPLQSGIEGGRYVSDEGMAIWRT